MPLFKSFRGRDKDKQLQEQQEEQQTTEAPLRVAEGTETLASELVRNNRSADDSVRILINKRSDYTNNAIMGEFSREDTSAVEDGTTRTTLSIPNTSTGNGSSSRSRSQSSARKFDKKKLPNGHPTPTKNSSTNSDNVNNNNDKDTVVAEDGENPSKKKGLLSFLSRGEGCTINNDTMVEGDDESVELPISDHKYDVKALRVPSILDQDNVKDEEVVQDVDTLLDDPYAELEGRKKQQQRQRGPEALMNDPDYEQEENSKKRFLMGLLSKTLFMIGAILFLVLATHDLKRVKNVGPSASVIESNEAATSALAAAATQEDLDINVNSTADIRAFKADRAFDGNVATDTHVWGTRRGLQQTNWFTEFWVNLPANIKEAAMLLGYNQGKWDNAEPVYSDRLFWDQLTPGQKGAAALVFGYNERTWNDYVQRFMENLRDTSAPTFKGTDAPSFAPDAPDPNKAMFYKNLWWNQLPADVQQAAADLGHTEVSWNNEDPLLTNSLFWDQLTDVERAAAETMGYNQETWDAASNGGPLTANDEKEGAEAEEEEGTASDTEFGNNDTSGTNDENETETEADGDDSNASNSTEMGMDGDNEDDSGEGQRNDVSSLVVNIVGKYPPEPRATKYQALYISAAFLVMIVGILDGFQQKLAFHAVMVLAGITGVMAGGFVMLRNANAFNICHSVSVHLFLLQAILLIYSRLLLTYDNVVRKTLGAADGLFAIGALVNVVVSYLRYDATTVPMARAAVAAGVFWVIAGLVYVGVTILFWTRTNNSWKSKQGSSIADDDEHSIAESCNVVPSGDGGEECEISYRGSPMPEPSSSKRRSESEIEPIHEHDVTRKGAC